MHQFANPIGLSMYRVCMCPTSFYLPSDCYAIPLKHVQASPDGIRDLAAAVQQSLASVTTQTSVPPACLQHIQQDLVRMANFVCLVAWRLHLRSRRARRLRQQQQDFAALQAPGTAFAAAAYDDSDVVVVVINEDVAQQIQPADAALGPIQQEHHVQNEAEHVQGLLDPQQQHMMEVTLHVEQQQQLAIAAPAPSDAPLPAPARVSVSVQTDDLGPTMREVNELLSGLKALMQPGNLSMKPGRATLALLNHHIKLQLQAWNLQPQQQVVAQQW